MLSLAQLSPSLFHFFTTLVTLILGFYTFTTLVTLILGYYTGTVLMDKAYGFGIWAFQTSKFRFFKVLLWKPKGEKSQQEEK